MTCPSGAADHAEPAEGGHALGHAQHGPELGVSAASVSRHWRAHGLKPHLGQGFKVSRDPQFIEKLEDIVGLYMSPPEHALVLG